MTDTLHGITELTPLEQIVDAGVLVRNYMPGTALADCDIFGVTDGGLKVIAKPDVYSPPMDGAYSKNIRGLERVVNWDVSIEGKARGANVDMIQDALVGSARTDLVGYTDTHYDIVGGPMSEADYHDNIALLVTSSAHPGLPMGAVFMVLNARQDNGLEVETKHGENAVFSFKYVGCVDVTAPQTPPYRVLYPKTSGGAS